MKGISIATPREWEAKVKYYKKENSCMLYPYGEYFFEKINGINVVFYSTGVRKVNGGG